MPFASSPATFGTLGGSPGDNAALVAALALKLDKAGGTMTGALVNSTAGANSTPPLYLTGALNVAGTGTTTFPHIFHQPTGAPAATTWSNGANAGTVFGANETTGFVGDFFNAQLAGSSRLRIDYLGALIGGGVAYGNFDIKVPGGSNRSVQLIADGGGSIILNGTTVQSFSQIRQRGNGGFATARNSSLQFATTDNDTSDVPGAVVCSGSGTPESVKTAPPGSIYLNQAGGASTTLYYKASGTGNTGWSAVA